MRGFWVLLLLILVLPVSAKQTQFNYDGFYARLKKSEQTKYSHITLAFLLQQQKTQLPCDIISASIDTDISQEPLTYAANGELILPYSDLLNRRKALIKITQAESAVPCDLNFRLRGKMPLERQVAWSELQLMHQQFEQLLQELAGLGKYFLPPMPGLTLHFPADVVIESSPSVLHTQIDCEKQQCKLQFSNVPASIATEQQLNILFNRAPELVVPWIASR